MAYEATTLLSSLIEISTALLEKVQSLESLLEACPVLDVDYDYLMSQVSSNLTVSKKIIKKFSSGLTLTRSRSTESKPKILSSLSLLETVKFFSTGRHLSDPLNQEKYLKAVPDSKSLHEFLQLYNFFDLAANENTFSKLKDLEQSFKLYLKRSNKTIFTRKSSYGLNSLFCDKFIFHLSKSSLPPKHHQEPAKSFQTPIKSSESSSFCQIFNSIDEAIHDIQNASSLTIGGFGVVGTPESILKGIHRKQLKNLKISTCLAGTPDSALGLLIKDKMIDYLHISHIGSNTLVEKQFLNGELEVEFSTQGSLVERFRAASMGIHSFYTPSGTGTFVEKGSVPTKFTLGGKNVEKSTVPKPFITENGKKFFLEKSISADFSIIKAWKADMAGNLIYKKTAKNSNPDIAGSGAVTIAEVEEIVPVGTFEPEFIHTPGIFVQRVVLSDSNEKYIERLSIRKDGGIQIPGTPEQVMKRSKIAKRAAQEIRNGMYVNLGIGIPTLIPNFVPSDTKIVLHGENGVLGIGPYPEEGQFDADIVNAGRETITINPGGSTFSSTTSFGMIRGNHLDITFLGGLQVSQYGDLANWIVPNMKVKGMGGAVDLVCSKAKCIVCMEHLVFGNMKILRKCKMPLTGKMVVDKLITDLAVFEFRKDGMVLVEIDEGCSVEYLRSHTQAEFTVDPNLKPMT